METKQDAEIEQAGGAFFPWSGCLGEGFEKGRMGLALRTKVNFP